MASDLPLYLQVAILGTDGEPVGSGLLLDREHILTCAHVVHMVAGIKEEYPPYDRDFGVRTLPWRGDAPANARLVRDAWKPTRVTPGDCGLRDLALLRLLVPLAAAIRGWGIYTGAHVPKEPVTLFAFPKNQPAGVRSDIVFKGGVADGWWQADNTTAAQYKVQRGFSGSPIFEPTVERVLGLVAEADRGEARVGFLIPGSILLTFLAGVEGLDLADRCRAPAPLFGVPDLPKKLERRTAVVQGIAGMLTGEHPTVGLVGLRGMGGIGKTVAARLLVDDPAIRRRFHDGIYWITVGENCKEDELNERQRTLLAAFGGDPSTTRSIDELREAITKELHDRHVLIVADDVWTSNDVRAFSVRSEGCAVIFTSRKSSGFDDNDVPIKNIELLSEPEAERLFRAHAGIADDVALDGAPRKVLQHCSCHALALVVAGSMVGRHPTRMGLILERFENADVSRIVANVPQYRRSNAYPNQEISLFRILQTSYELLDEREKQFLPHFAIFPEDARIPMTTIELLGPTTGLDELEIDQCIEKLDDAALLTYHRDAAAVPYVTLHDLQRDFVVCLCKEPRKSHAALVEAFRNRHRKLYLEGPGDADYFRRFMIYHLLGAAMTAEALALLIDPDWIGHRLDAKDPVWEIIGDYDLGLAGTGGAQ
jgi:NB-ARC domain/Trypsin-like peptidase domain/APAF-1 helical domain